MPEKDAKSVRLTITLDKSVHEAIKKLSRRMGLRTATWIAMVATTQVNRQVGESNEIPE